MDATRGGRINEGIRRGRTPELAPVISQLLEVLGDLAGGTADTGVLDDRQYLVSRLHDFIEELETDAEFQVGYLNTVAHALARNSKEGESCDEFLERTEKAIAGWRAGA